MTIEGGATGDGEPAAASSDVVEMAWDPITRIVGSLGIYAKVDFKQRVVRECHSTSSIFRGYRVLMRGKDPRDAHFITTDPQRVRPRAADAGRSPRGAHRARRQPWAAFRGMGVSGVTAVDQAANRGAAGPILFVRYAFPPNHRGYCGPADSTGFFEHGVAGTVDPGLREFARSFAGTERGP
jgi:hypothetical protein